MKLIAFFLISTAAFAAPPTYKVVDHIKIGGPNRWDYSFVDSEAHLLYVSHGTQTEVIDTKQAKLVATIPETAGVHGIAIAKDLGLGFISNGTTNDVAIFDLKTLKITGRAATGQNPDALIYEPKTHRVFVFNGRSNDATVIDGKTGAVVTASIPLGGKPEFSQVDGKGAVWVNIENTAEVVELDAAKSAVAKRYAIAPCKDPTGLVRNAKNGLLFSVCSNKLMIVSDPKAGKVLATVEIGGGCDGVALDDGYLFSSNGTDGTVTMVGETSRGKYEALATIPTVRSARTIAADPSAHKLYLPGAESAEVQTKDGKGRPQLVPESFQILVLGR